MNKKIVSMAMVLAFVFTTATVGFAAKVSCTVDSVDGNKVTMTCKKADKLTAGSKVKISLPKKKGAVEGC